MSRPVVSVVPGADLALTHFIEDGTGWSIKKLFRTARRYSNIQIRTGRHELTAEDSLPADLRGALAMIN